MTYMQKSGGTPNAVNVTTRAHNSLNQVTGLSGGGATLVRGVLNEPGSASIGKAGQPLVPARMTAGNTFEEELNLSVGQNTIAVRAEDATGNVSNYTFRTDIAPVAARNFTYDADGNMTSDGLLTYEWDCLNRLIRINRSPTKYTRFFYNALGQRVVIGEVDGSNYTDLKFLAWDGIQLLSLRKGPASSGYTGAKYERRYYPQGEQTLYQNPSTGTISVTATHHYTRDHLGSIREVVKTDGTLQARYDYDPYGKRIPQYESTAYGSCPFGYTGHYTQKSPIVGQAELVLTHFRAYDPELGRWLSADPIGEAGGINLYGYVGGEPIGSFDPLGLEWAVGGQLPHAFRNSTIVADGKGSIRIHIGLDMKNKPSSIVRSAIIHECVHAQDAMRDFKNRGDNSLDNAKDGDIVGVVGKDKDDVIRETEIRAHERQLAFLKAVLAGKRNFARDPTFTVADEDKAIRNEIKHIEKEIIRYKTK